MIHISKYYYELSTEPLQFLCQENIQDNSGKFYFTVNDVRKNNKALTSDTLCETCLLMYTYGLEEEYV